MKKLFAIQYKNLLLCRKTMVFYLIFAIIGPLFIYQQAHTLSSNFLPFFMVAMFVTYLIYQDMSTAEYKYKGTAYLSTTPYSRNFLIISEYIFVFLMFLFCLLIHSAISFFVPEMLKLVSLNTLCVSLLCFSCLFSLLIPLKIKFGILKLRIIFCALVIAIPYVIPLLLKDTNLLDFELFQTIPFWIFDLIFVGISLVVVPISIFISIKIFAKKDL